MKTIKIYNKEEAPQGSIFLYQKIERNGIIDISVPTTDVLKPNERIVYFFLCPKE